MRSPLLVVSADWHLEKNAWVRHPNLSGDSYYGLKQVVDIALLFNIPLVAAGDLFNHSYPDSYSVRMAMEQLYRLQKANLAVYYNQGQHEKTKDQPWLGLHSHPIHIHKKYADIKNIRLTGLDYTRPDSLIANLNEICKKDTDILIAHQTWHEFMGQYSKEAFLSSVPNIHTILTGDFHKHTYLRIKGATNQKLLVLSPGSLCLQTLDEPSTKAVFVLYDDMSFESVPIKSRVINHFDVKDQDELDILLSSLDNGVLDLQDDVSTEISKPIISIRYNTNIKDAFIQVSNKVLDKAHLFTKPISEKPISITKEIKTSHTEIIKAGLEGNLTKYCDANSTSYKIAKRLLTSYNPKEELNNLEKEYLS